LRIDKSWNIGIPLKKFCQKINGKTIIVNSNPLEGISSKKATAVLLE